LGFPVTQQTRPRIFSETIKNIIEFSWQHLHHISRMSIKTIDINKSGELTTKAIVNLLYGEANVLQFKEVEIPSPKTDEVLIKVHAVSINQSIIK